MCMSWPSSGRTCVETFPAPRRSSFGQLARYGLNPVDIVLVVLSEPGIVLQAVAVAVIGQDAPDSVVVGSGGRVGFPKRGKPRQRWGSRSSGPRRPWLRLRLLHHGNRVDRFRERIFLAAMNPSSSAELFPSPAPLPRVEHVTRTLRRVPSLFTLYSHAVRFQEQFPRLLPALPKQDQP